MEGTKLVTAEELERMRDDEHRYDLIRGELICMSPTGEEHGEIAGNIAGPMWSHVRATRLGKVYIAEVGFVLARNPDVVLAPDVSFVRADHLDPERDRRRFVQTAPDFAVEVVSPTDRAAYVSAKVREYLDAGTQLLWVVETGRRIVTVFTRDGASHVLTEQDTLDAGDVIPGFRLAVRDIFA
jgi:Uma2 family endonuclease